MESYDLWTDGASAGNRRGSGGWAAILCHEAGTRLALTGWEPSPTTNNRMELMAVIRGLEAVGAQRAIVTVHIDSAYVKNAFTSGWVKKWQHNGWRSHRGDDVANRDLWEELIALELVHIVKWVKVKGHQRKHSLNTVADALAVQAKKFRLSETRLLEDS